MKYLVPIPSRPRRCVVTKTTDGSEYVAEFDDNQTAAIRHRHTDMFGRVTTWCLILMCVVFPSCAYDDYQASASNGNTVREKHIALGGTSSIKRSDGSSLVEDLQTSFRDGTNMVTTVAGGLAIAEVSKAKTASDNAAATAQQAATLKAQTDAAKIAADAAKATGAQGVATAVVNKAPATSITPGFLSRFFNRGK